MLHTPGKASHPKRLLRVSVAFVCSLLVACTPLAAHGDALTSSTATTSTTSLFNMNIRLDRAAVLVGPDGADYIGWPTEDAEAILEVFEKRIPLMKEVLQKQERLSLLFDKQVIIHQKMLVESSSISRGWERLAGEWKEAALASKPSLFERIFLSKEAWLIAGLISGIALVKILSN